MTTARAIGVLVVDDHPAVRAGVLALIEAEPGLAALGAVGDGFAVPPAVHKLRPDVVVLDYQLPGTNGLALCRQIRRGPIPPAVLIYSAFASSDMVVPALVAGAGAIADKSIEPRELTATIRRLAVGETLLSMPSRALLRAAAQRLEVDDAPLLEMVLGGVGVGHISASLSITSEEVDERIEMMLSRLVVRGGATTRSAPDGR